MATKAETRQAIIEAAEILFRRFGPTKTSVADIARKLGMSPANIYNFFPSRDAILETVGNLNIEALKRELADETRTIQGDWPKISNLFLRTARHLRERLANETDILQLQVLEARNKWKFVSDFHDFLRESVQAVLHDAMQAGRFRKLDEAEAAGAVFDCMRSAVSPVRSGEIDGPEHERRIMAQLALLERAFL